MKTKSKLAHFEEEVSAFCGMCRRVTLEAVETALLLIGLYEVFRNHLLR